MWALICALVSHLFCVRWVYRVHFWPNKFFWGLKGKFYLRVLFYTTVFASMSDIHVLIHVCHYRHIGHKLELVSGFCKLIPFRSQIQWPSDQVSYMQIEYFSEVIESKVIFFLTWLTTIRCFEGVLLLLMSLFLYFVVFIVGMCCMSLIIV